MTPGTALTNQIRLAVSAVGARLFTTTVGRFWGPYHKGRMITKIETVKLYPGDVVIKGGHVVNVGTKGLSDLVGWAPYTVTADDVGTVLPVFVAVEVKAGADTVKSEQQAFIDAVNKNRGRAGVARTPSEAVGIVRGG